MSVTSSFINSAESVQGLVTGTIGKSWFTATIGTETIYLSALLLNSVAGINEKDYVKVSGVTNLDSNRLYNIWKIDVPTKSVSLSLTKDTESFVNDYNFYVTTLSTSTSLAYVYTTNPINVVSNPVTRTLTIGTETVSEVYENNITIDYSTYFRRIADAAEVAANSSKRIANSLEEIVSKVNSVTTIGRSISTSTTIASLTTSTTEITTTTTVTTSGYVLTKDVNDIFGLIAMYRVFIQEGKLIDFRDTVSASSQTIALNTFTEYVQKLSDLGFKL